MWKSGPASRLTTPAIFHDGTGGLLRVVPLVSFPERRCGQADGELAVPRPTYSTLSPSPSSEK